MTPPVRPGRATLQTGIAALGSLVVLFGLLGLATVPFLFRSDGGFAGGLAILFFGVHALAGFVILAAGLLIPQRADDGIQFSPRQRRLLAYGAVAPIASVLAVPIGATLAPPLAGSVHSALVALLVAFLCSGPLATLAAVGLRVRSRGRRPSRIPSG